MSSPIPGTESSDTARLSWWIWQKRMSQAEFAEAVGYPATYVNDVVKGRRRISRDFAQAVFERTQLDVTWLLTGEGNPLGAAVADVGMSTTTADGGPFAEVEDYVLHRCKVCQVGLTGEEEFCPGCRRRLVWPAKD